MRGAGVQNAVICVALAALVWFVFGQTLGHSFTVLDDYGYVYDNPHVKKGLSLDSAGWAFTRTSEANWHPLTWISHMMDCEFYGLNPMGHHLTNVLLHALVSMLLFATLLWLTAERWCSAFVAGLFAIHPLRVESVAWISERKDLLSGLFFLLMLIAYGWYARRRSASRYLLVALLLALGLMSKPVLVTAPLILLLLDYWPLRRFGKESWKNLVIEKLPLLAMVAASCIVTVFAQEAAISSLENFPVGSRLANATRSYGVYLLQFLAPIHLVPFYPSAKNIAAWQVLAALACLLGVTGLGWALRKRAPYVWVGWLWYVVMLVPMIGIVQVGMQAHADRYTYLPMIGIAIALAWASRDLTKGLNRRVLWLACGAAAVLVPLASAARTQTALWKSDEILWRAVLERTARNPVAHHILASRLYEKGAIEEALEHSRIAIGILPRSPEAHAVAAECLVRLGRIPEALPHYEFSVENPPSGVFLSNYGGVLLEQGRIAEGLEVCERALKLDPDAGEVHNNLGHALLRSGRVEEGIEHCRKAVELKPDMPGAHNNLAIGLMQLGRTEEAVKEYSRTLELDPKYLGALNNLSSLLATSSSDAIRDGPRALALAQQAAELSPGNPAVMNTLAAAHAANGDFDRAISVAREALRVAGRAGAEDLVSLIRERLASYEAREPVRE